MFNWLMKTIKARGMLPKVSATERAALDAGTVWIDGDFFTGKPNWQNILEQPYPRLSDAEQAYAGPAADEVCRQVDDWQLAVTRELPTDVLNYLKKEGFYGFNVPEQYGGKPLGAFAKSVIMGKLQPATGAVSTVVVIPNSLGPAELLADYGTEEQKKTYLPRLASGELTPCFGLTELTAGSDAASLKAEAVVFKGEDDSLKLRLNFRKRYITLAPIADIASIAVQLHDPENLLGKGERPGITVVLVEKGTKGFEIGKYHEPISPFPNGPLIGKNVVVPVDNIIGGTAGVGKGWRMLMETLSGGRAISLPAGALGAAKHAAACVGPYSMVREQFGIAIGKMEGVQAKVAKLAALTYAMEAARTFACGAIDRGESPPVISAIMKYRFTELSRELINDGMDVLGGVGVMQGPNNYLGGSYINAPVAITVEGANILTRTLIIFGQGAVRCHPYALKVLEAVEQDDSAAFRNSLLGWLSHLVTNLSRNTLNNLTRGWFTRAPSAGATQTYYRRLAWTASRFAVLTDAALFGVGGKLKAAGNLSGRFADILSWQFMAAATLRRWEAEGRRPEDLILVRWSLEYMLDQIQRQFDEIYANFPVPVIGEWLRYPGRAWLRLNPVGGGVPDWMHPKAARTIQRPGEQYDRLMEHVYMAPPEAPGMGRLLHAWRELSTAEPIIAKIRAAQKAGQLPRAHPAEQVDAALEAGVIDAAAAKQLRAAEAARAQAMEVDVFTKQQYTRRTNTPTRRAATGTRRTSQKRTQPEAAEAKKGEQV